MYVPLKVVSDYSLLRSIIKIKDLMEYLKSHNIISCALVDDNLFGVQEFYNNCINNNIKPIIGIDILINDLHVYLYAKNYDGYKHLIKINTLKQKRSIQVLDIDLSNIKVILPLKSKSLLKELPGYIGYSTEKELLEAELLTQNVVFINEIMCFNEEDSKYLDFLKLLKDGQTIENLVISNGFNYFPTLDQLTQNDLNNIDLFVQDINLELKNDKKYIPIYPNSLNDSTKYLEVLAKKGLAKRFKDKISEKYMKRLEYELKTISQMKYVDYFLIVYDYVLYAKKNNIYVGPGRGSAAGSLVSYSLGITDVDPLKYDLLFERFLNPERITMPDIDIDFEYTKRNQVISYVKEKYGKNNVAPIITFGTLASKQVLRDVAKIYKIDQILIDKFVNAIEAKESLKKNYQKDTVKRFIANNSELKSVYKVALKFEGLKKHISTHAAGVVICSKSIDNIIPVYYNNDELMTGFTMEYLEELGLLKMDFLALKNLTIISNVLSLIEKNNKEKINLNKINFEDERVYRLFQKGDTEGVFQFESTGIKNMLRNLKPSCFNDLVASIALFRPGPMDNINSYIKRKDGKERIDYLDSSLEKILKETYGIIVYQEQIMQILVKMANYTFAEADNVRRAMSKKKENIIRSEKMRFIEQSVLNGYSRELAEKVYFLILKFANYGFPKAHAVSYATIAYQMAYMKALYPLYFITNLLNMSINNETKTKEYLMLAKKNDITLLSININCSADEYIINGNKILLPISVIKNVGANSVFTIIEEREKNGQYKDFCDFVVRTYHKGINKLIIENLIKASSFDGFNVTKKTMTENLLIAINYAELREDLDETLVMKPVLEEYSEYNNEELRQFEFDVLGFYLTNHPSSKYTDAVKISNIEKNFDKMVEMVILIEEIKKIKTKKNEDMAFIKASDETGIFEMVVFSRNLNKLEDVKTHQLVRIMGKVMKRFDKYNVSVINLTKID